MNNKAQFTPGPWIVNTFIVNGQQRLEVLDATGANACVQANANLIAAAPAMYEALRSIPDHALDCKHSYPHTLACWNCIVKAALAQAEGRQA